jgi:hypothetical protein
MYRPAECMESTMQKVAMSLGMAAMDMGELDEAQTWLERAHHHALAASEVPLLGLGHEAMAYLHVLRGDWERARDELHRCLAILEDAFLSARTVVPRCWLTVGACVRGDVAATRRFWDLAVAACPTHPSAATLSVLAMTAQAARATPRVAPGRVHSASERIARVAWSSVLQASPADAQRLRAVR